MNENIKKYWPWVLGAIGGLYLYMHYTGASSSAGGSSAANYAAMLNAQNQAAATNAQIGLQQQQMQLQANAQQAQIQLATDQTNSAAVANYNASIASGVQAVGSAIGSAYSAAAQLPAQTINAASQENQAALLSSAQVASNSLAATPGNINASANLLSAAYSPLAYTGKTIAGISTGLSNIGVNALGQSIGNSVSSASNAASNSAQYSAQANANANASNDQLFGSALGAATVVALA